MNVKFRGSDGWGINSRYQQLYSNYGLQTISGYISKIDTITPLQDMGVGVQLIVKTDTKEDVKVHLGPSWFILRQDMSLSTSDRDKVEIRGAKVMIGGNQVVMAAEVRQKDRILQLRDKDGFPLWGLWREKNIRLQ